MIDTARARLGLAIILCSLVACKKVDSHEHASEHPEGHDHHAEDHGHGESMVRVTRYSEKFEVFAEHPSAIAGKNITLLAHVTVLSDFRPLRAGAFKLELDGPQAIRAEARRPKQAGIYELSFKAGPPGKYTGRFLIDGPEPGTIEGVEFVVHESATKAQAQVREEHGPATIEFLKEQQWGVPFGTGFVERGVLVPSIEVAGSIDTPPGGSAEIGAPVAGRLVPLAKGLPKPGDVVKKGQLLATMAPAPSSPEDAARATLAVTEAEARKSAAEAALGRAERLFKDNAISERELEDARRERDVAEQALRSAKRVEGVFSGASAGNALGSWKLSAAISGILTEVNATPGASVAAGARLFRIIDMSELWIRARVPEQDAAKLRTDRRASFQVVGGDAWYPLDVSDANGKASVVTVSRAVDPVSRTVEVIYALRDPDPALRVFASVRVSLPAGPDFEGLIVPKSALVDDEGRSVVYVQTDGEHFAARNVRVRAQAGDRVGIEHGLAQGERIVTRGAHLVRLADRSKTTEAHGHIH